MTGRVEAEMAVAPDWVLMQECYSWLGIEVDEALGEVGLRVHDTGEVPNTKWVQALFAKAKAGQALLELVADGGLVPPRLPPVPALKSANACSDDGNQWTVSLKQG
jgi:hypothetical protein